MDHAELDGYVPLSLEAEDVAAYLSIAEELGCDVEQCATGFMLATPPARRAAAVIWQRVVALKAELQGISGGPDAVVASAGLRSRLAGTLSALRGLIGLDPDAMPHDALAATGLRYAV